MRMIRSMRALVRPVMTAAVVLCGGVAAEAATVTTYNAQWNDGYHSGYLWANDLNDDSTITLNEVTEFYMLFDNMNGGPGQYLVDSRSPTALKFTTDGNGHGLLSGTAHVRYHIRPCAPWTSGPDCPLGDDVGLNWMDDDWNFSDVAATYVSSVPLPAAAPMLVGGVGALAVLRRRRRA